MFVLPLTGERKPTAIVQTPFGEVEPQFSPDGRWLAYMSNEGGTARDLRAAVSRDRGQMADLQRRRPAADVAADGKELFFVSDDRKFYAADIRTGSSFDYEAPRFLFDMRADVFNARNSYVPSRDGQRFLVNMLLDSGRVADQRHRQLDGGAGEVVLLDQPG